MYNKRMIIHFLSSIKNIAQHEAQQRNIISVIIDFKGFFTATKRNMTASATAQHKPPLSPFRGERVLLRLSRCGFIHS